MFPLFYLFWDEAVLAEFFKKKKASVIGDKSEKGIVGIDNSRNVHCANSASLVN